MSRKNSNISGLSSESSSDQLYADAKTESLPMEDFESSQFDDIESGLIDGKDDANSKRNKTHIKTSLNDIIQQVRQRSRLLANRTGLTSTKNIIIRLLVVNVVLFLIFIHFSSFRSHHLKNEANIGNGGIEEQGNEESIAGLDISIGHGLENSVSVKGRIKDYNRNLNKILQGVPQVNDKSEMSQYDTSKFIKMQRFDLMATANGFPNNTFLPFELTSYQSNMYNLTGSESDKCHAISWKSRIHYSQERLPIEEDLVAARIKFVKEDKHLGKIVEELHNASKKETIEESVKKQWLRFGSSAQWLEDHQCYLVFSRIIVTEGGFKGAGKMSLVSAQAFDKDWNEIKGKRIPFIDTEIPDDLEQQLIAIDKKYDLFKNCDEEDKTTYQYQVCVQSKQYMKEKAEEEKDELLGNYYRVYPTILKIPFAMEKKWFYKGPEDPKLILRTNKDGIQEPIVVYNIYDPTHQERMMQVVLPHRKISPVIPLIEQDAIVVGRQKNWTPFIKDEDAGGQISRGSLHMFSRAAPLQIVKCSLDTGYCKFVFDAAEYSKKDFEPNEIRGGTPLIKLPPVVPQLKGRNLWFGLMKGHIKECGISDRLYRPSLAILEEENGKYFFNLITDTLHFNTDVLGWSEKNFKADGYNVLSPNSVISWDVLSQNPETKSYDDYMQISVSQSDKGSYVIKMKGVLDFILQSYTKEGLNNNMDWESSGLEDRIELGGVCFRKHLRNYCEEYSKSHS